MLNIRWTINFDLMKKLLFSCILAIFYLFPSVYANIVDELTKLNNLYKDGVLNQEEFSKAKSILLQNKDEEKNKNKIEKVKKKKKEKKEKNKKISRWPFQNKRVF